MPENELVHVRGTFVGIESTGKRHNSYVFEFRTSHQLHGPGHPPKPTDRLLRFELTWGHGGRDLLAQLGGTGECPRPFDDVGRSLRDAPQFDVVLWLPPPAEEGVVVWHHEAVLVGTPVPVRD